MSWRAGGRVVLDVPRLELGPGVVHLQGPVGAGKTTLLRLAATLLSPATGSVTVAGSDTLRRGERVRAAVGYAGHEPSLPPELTVRQVLRFHARVHRRDAGAVASIADELGAAGLLERRVRGLSRGERTLADVARAALHAPRVLLLDEPAASLDDPARERLGALVARFRDDGALVVMTGHHGVAVAADRTVTLDAGRVAGDGRP